MTTLKDLTIGKLNSSLSSDVLDELAFSHMKGWLVPKIINIYDIFANIDKQDPHDNTPLKLLDDFCLTFPYLVERINSLNEYLRVWSLGASDDWIHEYDLIEDFYTIIEYSDKQILLYKKNAIYYSLRHEVIQGYKMHNEILNFFISRNIRVEDGCKIVRLEDF